MTAISARVTVSVRSEVVEREPSHRIRRGALLAGAVVAALVVALLNEPRDHAPLPAIARQALKVALPKWHTTEPVNEVVYGTRGFDTFGETFLLLAAVVAIATISRRREHRRGFIGEEQAGRREQAEVGSTGGGADHGETEARSAEQGEQGEEAGPLTPDAEPLGSPGPERAAAMTVVARGAIRLVSPFLLVAGLYLVAWGYSPGGGFPGGAVLLGGVLLVYVGFGYVKVRRIIRPDVIEPIELGGALLIVIIEALGLLLRGSFSANFLPLGPEQTLRSGGILQAFSGSELIEVSTGLTLAVFALLGMAHDWSTDEQGSGPSGSTRSSGSP
jgi:multicomponent Na+:H+ antiporter subunit B